MKSKLDMEHFAALVERHTTPLLEDTMTNEQAGHEMNTKPPPDWSTTVKIAIRDVLSWHLDNDKVSWAIMGAAGLAADIPEKYKDHWLATSIEITGDYFTVHLAAWDADTRAS